MIDNNICYNTTSVVTDRTWSQTGRGHRLDMVTDLTLIFKILNKKNVEGKKDGFLYFFSGGGSILFLFFWGGGIFLEGQIPPPKKKYESPPKKNPISLTLQVLHSFNCITEDCRLPRSAYFHFRFILPYILPYITWKKIFYYCIATVLLRIADCQGPLTFTFVLYCLTYCRI